MIKEGRLANGVRVITESMEGYRSASMGVWVRSGSVYENRSQRGASHFIEHMLFKGTEKRSASDIACEMDQIGGSANAFTAKECTCFYVKALSNDIGVGADILADIVYNSRFDDEDIEKEKGVVIEEIGMTEDAPDDVAHETLCTMMYGDTPLSLPILGTRKSVAAFTRDGLLSYMDGRYCADNMLIAVAGGIDHDQMMDELSKYFTKSSEQRDSAMPKSALCGKPGFKAIEKDAEQIHICIGFPGFANDTPDSFALSVLSNAIGGSMSSRLFQRIREEKGLCYSTYSYSSGYSDSGYFSLYAGTGEKQAATVTKLMLEELASVSKCGITEDELVRSRDQLKGSFILGQESTSARSNALGRSMLLRGRTYTEQDIIARIDGVSMDDIWRIIPTVTDTSRMSAAIAGRVKKVKNDIGKLIQEGV